MIPCPCDKTDRDIDGLFIVPSEFRIESNKSRSFRIVDREPSMPQCCGFDHVVTADANCFSESEMDKFVVKSKNTDFVNVAASLNVIVVR